MIGREFALQLPTGAVAMDAEEMMYVEGGGYSIYRGGAAWRKISSMMSEVATWYGTSWHLAKVAAASVCATAIGTLIAVVSALGTMLTVAAGGIQAAMTGCAIVFTINGGGFKASDLSFWCWNMTSVKPL